MPAPKLRILSWNIRQGGGSRTLAIGKVIQESRAEILVLSEFRNNANGLRLRTQLLKLGYHHQTIPGVSGDTNSVILASKLPFNAAWFPDCDPEFNHAIVRAEFPAFQIYGCYLPHKKKHRLFDFLLEDTAATPLPDIIVGDLNSGINGVDQKGDSFWYSDRLIKLHKSGRVDAFRHLHGDAREYSWFSHGGNGFRYDHTLVHEDLLPIVSGCYYLHKIREDNVSDHAPMMLELG